MTKNYAFSKLLDKRIARAKKKSEAAKRRKAAKPSAAELSRRYRQQVLGTL